MKSRFLHLIRFPARTIISLITLLTVVTSLSAQPNEKPEIIGQEPLSTPQGTPLEILLTHLHVEDPDNVYPDDFTLKVDKGKNYSVNENTVTPDAGFTGTLTVKVTVNDGNKPSPKFDLIVEVIANTPTNIPPVITGQVALSTDQGQPITIQLSHLMVDDPDDTYPEGFSLALSPGTGYTIVGQTITPDESFIGTLNVPVTVNDGEGESEPFNLAVTVNAAAPQNVAPVITGQVPLSTMQGTAFTVTLAHITVTDPDNIFPGDFTLTVGSGANYSVSGNTVTPNATFVGTLLVSVRVSDGTDLSAPFTMEVAVEATPPGNVKPEITGQVPLTIKDGESIEIKPEHLTVTDPDDTYPSGFTLAIAGGANYSVSGTRVTAQPGFTGKLSVPVTVNDGEANSDPFNVSITVEPNPVQNVKPTIIGQNPLSILNTETLSLQLSHLFVTDPDDTYPNGFTLKVYAGSGYTFTGTTIKPEANFTGTLTVKVSVNDGEDDSNVFDLKVTVTAPAMNVKPVITGQQELTTFRNTPLTLRLTHLIVSDPDDEYPGTFTMQIVPGSNYSVSGSIVTPSQNFIGTLLVGVRVNDGTVWSEQFLLTVTVVEKDELRISSQKEIIVEEDSVFSLGLQLLEVNDPSGSYPSGFRLIVSAGDHYSFAGTTVTPASDFSGTLEIPVRVENSTFTSNTFKVVVLVTPRNDPPQFSTFDQSSIPYSSAYGPIEIAEEVDITDPDNEVMVFAEVFIEGEVFTSGKDYLTAPSSANIRSVFDPNTGILVLLGVAPLTEYQSVIRSVTYTYDNDTIPQTRNRPIHFRLNDGEAFSKIYTKNVAISEAIVLDIPNVFTPNDDLSNDTWVIRSQNNGGNTSATIRVFDKRGGIVYQSHSLDQAWDGKFEGENLPSDTYFYTIEIRSNASPITRKGVITILR